jgi:hypothetical protein
MPANSILSPAGLALRQNVIYRARMLIKAPGFAATEGKVREALEGQGFREVQFVDKKALPPDWPADEYEDPSGAFSWTAYLQGRFSLTDRTITFAELPGTVEVLGMWTHLIPLPSPTAQPAPVPAPAPPVVLPPEPVSESSPMLTNVLAGALGGALAFWLTRAISGRAKSRRSAIRT